MSKFCHLHNHSTYSLLDGLSNVKDIVKTAKSQGSTHVAITDHGNIYNIHEFVKSCKEHEVKPVIGCEFYYSPDVYKNSDKYHLLVLAYNDTGLKNLYKLISISSNQFYEKPKITKKDLFSYHEGLFVTSGCIASYFNRLIIQDKYELLEKEIKEFLDVFGNRFIIEFQDHGLKDQEKVNKYWIQFLRKHKNLIGIGTNDAHYVRKEDADIHDMLLAIQTGKQVSDKNRLRFTDDNGNLLNEFYMKSYDEMLQKDIFRENVELLYNTVKVSEQCEYSNLNFDGKVKFPKYHKLDNNQDVVEYFKNLVYSRAKKVLGSRYSEYKDRLDYEVDVITRLGFTPYFLIIQDIVNAARDKNILVGLGRGSAAGSLVSYVLGITNIDPVRYGLLFDRFINPERVSPPDIDIDFEDHRREEVIKYIRDTYGHDKTCNIITFSKMHLKMAMRDILRSLGVGFDDTNKFVDECVNYDSYEEMIQDENNKQRLEKWYLKDPRYKKAVEMVKHFDGKVRQVSVHASGIVIADRSLDEIMGVSVVSSGGERVLVTSYDMKGLEDLGLLKVDVLGLRTLSVINNCIHDLEKKGIKINIYELEPNEPEVYQTFSEGKTTGVFQFESDGMRDYLKKMKPSRIEDLIALNALYRPGPMQYIDNYIRRKNGLEKYQYYDDRLKDVLEETYGIIVYQEQIMKIVQIIAGYSLAKADLMRRAIGKKVKEIIDKEKQTFIENAIKNGVSRETAQLIYEDIEKFADYGFNKSHAASYSMLAYVTAYFKTKYPSLYYKHLLNSYEGNIEKITYTIYRAYQEDGIIVKVPDLFKSRVISGDFSIESDKVLLYGMNHVKGVRSDAVNKIIEYKTKNKLRDINDFIRMCIKEDIDKKTIEGIFWGGFLGDNIRTEYNLKLLLDTIDFYKSKNKNKKDTGTDLFSGLLSGFEYEEVKIDFKFDHTLDKITEEIIKKEVDYLGYSYSIFSMYVNNKYDYIVFDNLEYREHIFSKLCDLYVLQVNEKVSSNNKKYLEVIVVDLIGFTKKMFVFDSEVFGNIKSGQFNKLYVYRNTKDKFNSFLIKKYNENSETKETNIKNEDENHNIKENVIEDDNTQEQEHEHEILNEEIKPDVEDSKVVLDSRTEQHFVDMVSLTDKKYYYIDNSNVIQIFFNELYGICEDMNVDENLVYLYKDVLGRLYFERLPVIINLGKEDVEILSKTIIRTYYYCIKSKLDRVIYNIPMMLEHLVFYSFMNHIKLSKYVEDEFRKIHTQIRDKIRVDYF